MKLTVKQLQAIIKEEVEASRPGAGPSPSTGEDDYDDRIVDYTKEEDALYAALEDYMYAAAHIEDPELTAKCIKTFVRKKLALLVKELSDY